MIWAIEAAPAAIPPKPKTAAISAITKKIKIQRNIIKLVDGSVTSPKKPYQPPTMCLSPFLVQPSWHERITLGNVNPKTSNKIKRDFILTHSRLHLNWQKISHQLSLTANFLLVIDCYFSI